MPLTSGTRLGPYEILSAIGAGGMGEVYRARDDKLGRDVALKILPDAFATDADRLARFRREAQVLASLNHPNIGHIYGFEDTHSAGSGQAGVTHALVLELVEGPTLADRIAAGPMPLADALPIARQIAEALEAAHEQGIVHRDLTAERNAELSPDGRWVAYESVESGDPQIYVRPFPDVNGGRWQISTSGGTRPVWAPSGRELFYVAGTAGAVDRALHVVAIQTTPSFSFSNPAKLFDVRIVPGQLNGRFFDVSRDGQRFIVIKGATPVGDPASAVAPLHLVFVVNWIEELKAKLEGR